MRSFWDYWRAIAGFWSLRFDKGGSPPKSPPAPDPVKTIQAQALATPSIHTPTGNSIYSGDPSKGTFQRIDTLAPEQQKQFDLRSALASSMLGQAGSNAAALPAGPLQPGMDSPGTQAYWQREKGMLDQVFDRQDRQREQKLSNQGLPIGSDAYEGEQNRAEQQQTDEYERAAQGALGAGFGQDLASRQQNYNELAQALSGGTSAVPGSPSFVDPQAALDAQQMGQNREYQGQLAGYNANVATNNNTTNSVATLAAAAALMGF